MQLGFVGTGTMGNPMACCLIAAGHQLTVYDLRREATTNLCELGARWAETPRTVAEASEVVFTSLPGPTEVEQGVLDPVTGILAGLRTGGAYIDMTTNAPRVFRRLAEACRARGIEFVVLYVPSHVRVLLPYLRFKSAAHRDRFCPGGLADREGDLSHAMAEFCDRLGCPLIDMGPPLRRRATMDMVMVMSVAPVASLCASGR